MELPAYELRDKGSNLDLHVQSVVSCRLDDPGPLRASVQLRRPKLDANAKAVLWHVQLAPHDVFHATRLPFDPGSSRIDVLRGGALEPEPLLLAGKIAC